MSALAWIGVAVLGGVGALARVTLDALVGARLVDRLTRGAGGLALGTFVVNVSGAFLLGLVDGLALTGDALVLVGTATIGAYTTFSTWMLQSHMLAVEHRHRVAGLNLVLSVVLGFGAVALGRVIGTLL